MRFSTTGDAVMGVGDSAVSVNNARTPYAGISGEADWIDDTRIGYRFRADDGVYHLAQWTLGTPQPALLSEQSATTFRAGGGVWAAFLAGSGVRTSAGQAYPAASLCDVSPAGEIILCPDYQLGRDLQIIARNGQEFWIGTEALGADATAGPNVRLRDGIVLYQANAGWHLNRLGSGPITFWQRVAINYAVHVVADGEIYLLEREAYRLTLRKASGVSGWVIATGESLWAPDAVQVQAGEILIGWAGNAGETPGSLRTFAQRLDAPTVPLDGEVPVPPLPPSGDDPPSTPIVSFPNYRVPDVAPIGRTLDVGPFFATDLRAGDFAAPGNRQIVCNGSALIGNDLMHVPVFVDLQSSFNPPELICGFFAPFANNSNSMGNAGLTCAWNWHKSRFSPSDLLRYFDGPEIPMEFIAQCEANAIVLVQCYPLPGETVSVSMARFRASVKRVTDTGRDVGIVPALNTKFGGNGTFAEQVATIIAIQEPLVTMVRETPKCKKVFYFSYGRWKKINGKIIDCGAAFSAELQMWAKKWASLAA